MAIPASAGDRGRLGYADATSAEGLYDGLRDAPWDAHLDPDRTFAVNVVGTNRALRNPHFTALKAKDAVVVLGQVPTLLSTEMVRDVVMGKREVNKKALVDQKDK